MATGDDLVSLAKQQADRGAMYKWAAAGPDEFDCSGLLYWAAKQLGIDIPRTTYDMTAAGSSLIPIGQSDLSSGDFVFSNWGDGVDSHVGVYDGAGHIIEAPQEGKPVTVTPFDQGYQAHVTNYRRVPGLGKGSGSTAGAFGAGFASGVAGVGKTLTGWINAPKTVTDAMTNVGSAAGSMAQSMMEVGKVANLVTKLFLPSNLLRAFAMFAGIVFVLIGVWFLAREARES